MHRSPIPEPDVASGPPSPGDERYLWRVAATNSGMKAARQALVSDEAAESHWTDLAPAAREDAKALAESFAQDGTQIWTKADVCWPLRDCDKAPGISPFLFVRGPRRLLADKGVGICGSRDASERGLRAAQIVGAESARAGMPTASGHARGVDTETHIAALKAGGGIVLVLPEGINRFRMRKDLREAGACAENTTVVSQFPPNQRWTAGGAMARNAVICGLSRIVVVVEARSTGGTIDAGRKALSMGRTVLALEFSGAESPQGNVQLVVTGAHPVASAHGLRRWLQSV